MMFVWVGGALGLGVTAVGGLEEAEDSYLWVSVDAEEDWSGRTDFGCRAVG